MVAKQPIPESLVSRTGTRRGFQVVIAYDDFAAGKRAMDACKLLMSQLGGEVQLRSGMWKFDLLRNTQLNQLAAADAIEADVVMVAAGENPELPAEVRAWIEAWAPCKRGQTAALVALLDPPNQEISGAWPVHDFLKQAAATAGMDFLPQALQLAKPSEPSPRRDFTRSAPEGWGLND